VWFVKCGVEHVEICTWTTFDRQQLLQTQHSLVDITLFTIRLTLSLLLVIRHFSNSLEQDVHMQQRVEMLSIVTYIILSFVFSQILYFRVFLNYFLNLLVLLCS